MTKKYTARPTFTKIVVGCSRVGRRGWDGDATSAPRRAVEKMRDTTIKVQRNAILAPSDSFMV